MSSDQKPKYPGMAFFEDHEVPESSYARVMVIMQGLGIPPESIVGKNTLQYAASLCKTFTPK